MPEDAVRCRSLMACYHALPTCSGAFFTCHARRSLNFAKRMFLSPFLETPSPSGVTQFLIVAGCSGLPMLGALIFHCQAVSHWRQKSRAAVLASKSISIVLGH